MSKDKRVTVVATREQSERSETRPYSKMFEVVKLPKTKKKIDEFVKNSKKIPISLVYPKKRNDKGKTNALPIKMIVINENEDKLDNVMDGLTKINDPAFVKDQLKINPKRCPFCDFDFTNKYNCKRHIRDHCPFKKIEKFTGKNIREDGRTNEIKLKDTEQILSQFPNPKLRDICYVAAPYGAGKSTYTKNYIKEFTRLFEPLMYSSESSNSVSGDDVPQDYYEDESYDSYEDEYSEEIGDGKTIYLISRIEDDEAFRDLIESGTMTPVDINDPDLINNPINAKEELSNSLIVFDDYELLDKSIQKSIEITLKDVMLNGRDQANLGNDIYAIITAHQITNYSKTRDILNECSSITLFPKAGSTYHIRRVLRTYCGFGKDNIEKIINLPSRWITIYKRWPMWVMYSGGVYKPS